MANEKIKTEKSKGEILIKSSSEKLKFWKPTNIGDNVQGKLIAIQEGNFGKVLKLKTQKGIIGVNVSAYLEDIDFLDFSEQVIKFTFTGKKGKRGMRVFNVVLIPSKD